MSNLASVVSDSDGKVREASVPVSNKATDEERENVEDDKEYDIEEILDHEPGMFEVILLWGTSTTGLTCLL
jgi:hypothetical protein